MRLGDDLQLAVKIADRLKVLADAGGTIVFAAPDTGNAERYTREWRRMVIFCDDAQHQNSWPDPEDDLMYICAGLGDVLRQIATRRKDEDEWC